MLNRYELIRRLSFFYGAVCVCATMETQNVAGYFLGFFLFREKENKERNMFRIIICNHFDANRQWL